MPSTSSSPNRRFARVLTVVAIALGVGSMSWITASAAPSIESAPLAEPPVLSAVIESSSTAVPLDGVFGYTARIRLTRPASYLQTRVQIRRPSGRLVFQRTIVANAVPAGEQSASYERSLAGINLPPGSYPVEFEIRADVEGSTVTTELATQLLVYDPAQRPAGVVMIAHIDAQPLEAPDGRFVADPAVAAKTRDDVVSIASLILADANARLSLSVPPMLLSEWRRTADGYTAADGTLVSAADPLALSYAGALELLQAAIVTGRLELVSTGFADPDLAQLSARGRSGDIVAQYRAGFTSTFASLETSPSTGTVPAGVCIPPAALSMFKGLGLGYVVLDAGCARSVEGSATSGAYPISNSSIRALLSDTLASTALSSAETSEALTHIAARQILAPNHPVTVQVELTESGPTATATVVSALRALQSEPWAHLELGRDALQPSKAPAIRLIVDKSGSEAPEGHWDAVSLSRTYADALVAAVDPTDTASTSAYLNSLIAQASAWEGPDGTWSGAVKGEQFAAASLQTSKSILDAVTLTIEPITLSSARGSIPVSLRNGSNQTLQVSIRTSTAGGIDADGRKVTSTVLRPQETFIQIPVNMHSSLAGKLTVAILAGDLVVARRTIDVRASYLDRLVIIGGIVLALGILLAFIVRRVRAAERTEREHIARYTESLAHHPSDSKDR